jgi:chitodextrinase
VASAKEGRRIALEWQASTDDVGVAGYEVFRGQERVGMTGGRSFLEPALAPAIEHCFSVRAFDLAGNRSPPAGPACVTIPDTSPPSVPAKLTAKPDGERQVTLAWEASSDDVGVARYDVVRTGAEEASGQAVERIDGRAARDEGLTAATRYCYTVRACDAAGNCSPRSPQACATTPDLTPPTVPGAPAAAARGDREIHVRWGASEDNVGVAGYDVSRDGQAHVRGAKDTSLRDAELHPGVRYCYAVRAVDAAGNRSPASQPACATTPDLTPPSAPGRPAATSVSSAQMYVAWDPSHDDVGVTGYELYRGSHLVARVTGTRAREPGLQASKEYCYTIRALDAAGNRSEPSAPACATTAAPSDLASPSDLRVVRSSATSLLLQWEPSEHRGVLYRIYAKGIGRVGLTRADTYAPAGQMGAGASCYRVAAVDAEGRESPMSNEVCAAAGEPVSRR